LILKEFSENSHKDGLIGGPNVYSRLQQDRHNRSDGGLGLLATTIQQEVLVAPISFESTEKLFEKAVSKSLSEQVLKTLWLRSYANLATIIRNHEKKHYSHNEKNEKLADCVVEIWASEDQLDYIHFSTDESREEKIHDEWVQNWIHTGMLVFANRLLNKPVSYPMMREQLFEHWPESLKDASEMVTHPEIWALQSEDALVLMALGEQILFSYLEAGEYLSSLDGEGKKGEYIRFIYRKGQLS